MNDFYVFIVMGVSGVGKTTIGRDLASRLSAHFIEADDHHSGENRTAMAQGDPLTDAMRQPWLLTLAGLAEGKRQSGPVVMTCSALKRSYRDLLRARIGKVRFIYLKADENVLADRMAQRADHFMPVSQLDNQLATLEEPTEDESALMFNASLAQSELLDQIEMAIAAAAPA